MRCLPIALLLCPSVGFPNAAQMTLRQVDFKNFSYPNMPLLAMIPVAGNIPITCTSTRSRVRNRNCWRVFIPATGSIRVCTEFTSKRATLWSSFLTQRNVPAIAARQGWFALDTNDIRASLWRWVLMSSGHRTHHHVCRSPRLERTNNREQLAP